MESNFEKSLGYLLWHMGFEIDRYIWRVIYDSEEDPEYSAVTTTNMIKCYIDVLKCLGEDVPYSTVKEYIRYKDNYTEEEYNIFEAKRKKEAEYYIGEIF